MQKFSDQDFTMKCGHKGSTNKRLLCEHTSGKYTKYNENE